MKSRREILLSGWLWSAIAVTAVNDHVLKSAFPGVVTGKLSDFSGLAMVALATAALVGRRWPVIAVAAAFTLLKTVPGAPALAAPVLGGRTLSDATDLVALTVLVPVWLWLGRPARRSAERPIQQPHRQYRRRVPAVLATGAVTAGQVLVVGSAVLVTSATSCGPGSGVSNVAWMGGEYVAVQYPPRVWTSADGASWQELPGADIDMLGDLKTQVELDDGTGLTVEVDRVIEVAPDGSTSIYQARVVGEGECSSDPADSYQAVATDGQTAVVAMGEVGVAVRDGSGQWSQVSVGEFNPAAVSVRRGLVLASQILLVVCLFALIVGVVVMAASDRPNKGPALLMVIGVGLIFLVLQLASISYMNLVTGTPTMGYAIWCLVWAALWAGLFAGAAALMRPMRDLPPA
ncbi:MAG: hypothetical protein ACK5H2_08365 [Beutenbergiaceae bacterium]